MDVTERILFTELEKRVTELETPVEKKLVLIKDNNFRLKILMNGIQDIINTAREDGLI